MDFLVLTKTGGVFGPIAEILGWIMEALFQFTSLFGVVNIGLSIILFTVVMKLIMFPLTVSMRALCGAAARMTFTQYILPT